jgi:hypothetical protein
MTENTFIRRARLIDQYGNQHDLSTELARGGQGVVYRTSDVDLAIKQPLGLHGETDRTADLQQLFQNVRCLPLPPRIPISLPLAVLRDEPGYVMSLLSDMVPFSSFELSGDGRDALAAQPRPTWLSGVKDENAALPLMHYAKSGATRRRLSALAKVAAALARLHAVGLVYGDISLKNCFVGEGENPDAWLIDADNLRFELLQGGSAVVTTGYGAPEVVRGTDRVRPRTDAWAFAVMAFATLTLVHPFIGKKVLNADDDDGGWDAEPLPEGAPADLDERAHAGYMPFVDDESDDSNRAVGGMPRHLVLTPALLRLFQETFGAGRVKPWRRPAMAFWALELARAHDLFVACPSCFMSYINDRIACPYCDTPRPPIAIASTRRWKMAIQKGAGEVKLPHRLFHPFSLELNGKTAFEAALDFDKRTANHVRGTEKLPAELSFQFIAGGER